MVPLAYLWQRRGNENLFSLYRANQRGNITLRKIAYGKALRETRSKDDGASSLMVKLRSVAAAIRVRFP
jgi:hypothetical protein